MLESEREYQHLLRSWMAFQRRCSGPLLALGWLVLKRSLRLWGLQRPAHPPGKRSPADSGRQHTLQTAATMLFKPVLAVNHSRRIMQSRLQLQQPARMLILMQYEREWEAQFSQFSSWHALLVRLILRSSGANGLSAEAGTAIS